MSELEDENKTHFFNERLASLSDERKVKNKETENIL